MKRCRSENTIFVSFPKYTCYLGLNGMKMMMWLLGWYLSRCLKNVVVFPVLVGSNWRHNFVDSLNLQFVVFVKSKSLWYNWHCVSYFCEEFPQFQRITQVHFQQCLFFAAPSAEQHILNSAIVLLLPSAWNCYWLAQYNSPLTASSPLSAEACRSGLKRLLETLWCNHLHQYNSGQLTLTLGGMLLRASSDIWR